MFTKDLEMCLMAAQSEAIDRRHEYLCVEHILFALLHNDAGLHVIHSCGGDTNLIKMDLEDFFSQQEEVDENKLPRQTRAVQRVLHLAIMHVNSSGKASADVGDVLVAIHRESQSYASYFLQKQDITRLDLLNYISHDNITTFGRGGSDYTATIIASCINADEIWLMSDVEGLMTADPKLVKNARLLSEVSYAEAIEMAQFGAKQIHPRTFEPILSKKIPMRIRSTFDTKNTGTIVTASPSERTKRTVKCVSAIRNIGLIDLSGGITFAAPGTASKIFTTLAEKNVNVLMVSSNPSESSLSLIVKKSDLDKAVTSLEMNLLGKTVKKIDATPSVSIVAVIGSGMRGTVGVASKVFSAAHKVNANVMMIAQGSSELNLAFVVKDSDCKSVVQSLHTEFKLDKIN